MPYMASLGHSIILIFLDIIEFIRVVKNTIIEIKNIKSINILNIMVLRLILKQPLSPLKRIKLLFNVIFITISNMGLHLIKCVTPDENILF